VSTRYAFGNAVLLQEVPIVWIPQHPPIYVYICNQPYTSRLRSLVCQQHATARAARARAALQSSRLKITRTTAGFDWWPMLRSTQFRIQRVPLYAPVFIELVSRGSVRLNGHDVFERARYVGSVAEAI
jgi:hypothetical protein